MAMVLRAPAGRSAAPRIIAALLGVACLWGPLAALAHVGSARHVVCAEHGDLMDAPIEAAHAWFYDLDLGELELLPSERLISRLAS